MADDSDEIAALEAIRVALTEVGDGGAYVWHRQHGRLSGVVIPTASFKDRTGRVCRHIHLLLTRGERIGSAEGIACRLGDGRWQLDG
jgi:surface antigen